MRIHAWNQPVSQVSSVPNPNMESVPPPSSAVIEERPSHVMVSGPGQLISKLMLLKQEDPNKFSEVVSGLAGSLRETADALDGRIAKRLDNLASKLDDIASGGDIGQLARRDHVRHGHHGHHGHHGVELIDGEGNGFSDADGDSVPPPSAGTPPGAEVAAPVAAAAPPAAPAVAESDAAASVASATAPNDATNVHQKPTLAPPATSETAPPSTDAEPTRPWNPPPALLAFSRFDDHHHDDDREAMRFAFASLLDQLDTALAS